MTRQGRAYLYALITVFIWSTIASAFKISLGYLEPIQLLLYAGSISTLLLAVILLVQGKFRLIFSCTPRQYAMSLFLGLLNPFLYYLILLQAYSRLPAQQAQPLNYTWAITLALLSVPLLGQKLRLAELGALLVSYMGVVVIATEGQPFSLHFTDGLGVALALASTIIWALYWIYNTRDTRDPVVALLVNFLCSFPFVLGYCLIFSEVVWPPLPGLLGAIYIGFFEMGACFVLWLLALRTAENTARISSLIFLSPFVSLFFIHFLVGEEILPATFAGLLLIVCGLLWQKTLGQKRST